MQQLAREDRALAWLAPVVAAESARAADDAVAGHQKGNRVAADGGADCAMRLRSADGLGQLCVGREPASRYAQQCVPNLELEVGTAQVEREWRSAVGSRENALGHGRSGMRVLDKGCTWPAGQQVGVCRGDTGMDEGEMSQAPRRDAEQRVAEGRVVHAPPDRHARTGIAHVTR